MIEKQIMIPKTVYESVDGQQFEKQYEAEKHDCQLYFKTNMSDRYRNVMETGYCVINSKEEAEILETLSISGYIQKGFYDHYLKEDVKFPVMVKFTDDFGKSTEIVTESDYTWVKEMREKFDHLCIMYD